MSLFTEGLPSRVVPSHYSNWLYLLNLEVRIAVEMSSSLAALVPQSVRTYQAVYHRYAVLALVSRVI